MKKLLLMMVGLVLCLSGFANNTKTTVFYAITTDYTVKVNFQLQSDNNDSWYAVTMKKTGLTYNGMDIYVGCFEDWYSGVANLQFQLYDGETWISQEWPINSWTGEGTYNNKLYYNSSWIEVTTDQIITVHYSNPSGWTTIQAYAWCSEVFDKTYNSVGNGAYGSNAAISENALNTGYYDYSYNNVYNYVIFNNNGSSTDGEKTPDVSIDYSTAREFWVSSNSATTASTTAPEGWVGYKRTGLTSGNFGTICLPFAATVEGATVFEITGKVMSGDNLTGINLTSVENLAAGHAYIFKATASELTATYSGSYSAAAEGEAMVGNLSSTNVKAPLDSYVLGSDNLIHKVAAANAVNVGQYKAYIDLTNVVSASRGANFIGFEDEATGIESVWAEQSQSVVYNMQGQRVTDAQKGLVIAGGKKMLRK